MKRIVLIDDLVEDGVERPRLNISCCALVARIRRSYSSLIFVAHIRRSHSSLAFVAHIRRSYSSLIFVAIRTFECPKVLERVAR